jgi:hypothetical protein
MAKLLLQIIFIIAEPTSDSFLLDFRIFKVSGALMGGGAFSMIINNLKSR